MPESVYATPESAYHHFIEFTKAGDIDGAKQLAHQDFFYVYTEDFFLDFEKHSEAMQRIADYSMVPESVSENMAKFKVHWVLQDGQRARDTVTLKKEDDRWLVCDPF